MMPVIARTALSLAGAAVVTLALFASMPLMLRIEPPPAYPDHEIAALAVAPVSTQVLRTGRDARVEAFTVICGWRGERGSMTALRISAGLAEPLPPGHVYARPLVSREEALQPIPVVLI